MNSLNGMVMPQKTEVVRARIDPELKRKVEDVLNELGLTHSALINMTYRAVARSRSIPFSLNVPNEETAKELEFLKKPENRKTLPVFDSVEALMADLEDD